MVWEVQLWDPPEDESEFTILDSTVVVVSRGGGRTTFLNVFKPEEVGGLISHKTLCEKLYPFVDIFPMGSIRSFDHATKPKMPYLYPGLVCETVIDPRCKFVPVRCNNWAVQAKKRENYQIMLMKLLSGVEWTQRTTFKMHDDTKVWVKPNKFAAVATWIPQSIVIGESSWCGGVGWRYGLLVRTDREAGEFPVALDVVQTKRSSMSFPRLNSVRGSSLEWPSLTLQQLDWAAGFETVLSVRGVTKFMLEAKEVVNVGRASVVSFARHLDSLLMDTKLHDQMEERNVGMVRAKRGSGKTFFIYSAAKAAALSGKSVVLLVGPNALMDATTHLGDVDNVSICAKSRGHIVWAKGAKPERSGFVFLVDNAENLLTKSCKAMSGVWTSCEVEGLANEAGVVVLSVLMNDRACTTTLSTHMLRLFLGLAPFLQVWKLSPVVSSFVHTHFGLERIAPRILCFQTEPIKEIEFVGRFHQREWSVNPMFDAEQQCVARIVRAHTHTDALKNKINGYICDMWFSDTTVNERRAQTSEILNGITHFSTKNMKRKQHVFDPMESMFGTQNSPRKRQKHFETHEEAKTLFSYLTGNLEEGTSLDCLICFEPQNAEVVVFSKCRHFVCSSCAASMQSTNYCPKCRTVSQTEVLKRGVGNTIESHVSNETGLFEKHLLMVVTDAVVWATKKGPTLLVSKKNSILDKMTKLVGEGGIPFSESQTYENPGKDWPNGCSRFCVCNIDKITDRNIQAFTGVIVVGSLSVDENSSLCNALGCGPTKRAECCIGYIMPRGLKSKLL